MSSTARTQLADLLASDTRRSTFSASRTAPATDLVLEVRGVGPIALPVTHARARELCAVSRPAHYGRGEATLVDRTVRDTWEVPKSRVRIDKRRFDRTLVPVLDKLRSDLGLPASCELRAELHSLLVYAPGQFFLPHQDSEVDDAMVGSLVVGLPSAFTGGALEVRQDGERATYRGSKTSLSFVAFYGDCRHQVKPVTSGYRVVLTYDLVAQDERRPVIDATDTELVAELAGRIGEHFAGSGAPGRLVYLLDHEYTSRALDWTRLKGDDARSVALLEAAADRAGCDLVLALADEHETWSADEPDRQSRWTNRHSDWDDDDSEDDDEDDADDRGSSAGSDGEEYELGELVESELTLLSWIDTTGARESDVGLSVHDDEICPSTPAGDMRPYASEYEGYMGNWGNTLDRWYHRGAAVLWPRERAFAVRAEVSPAWAIDTLIAQARAGDLAGAREAVATLEPFWDRRAGAVATAGFLAKVLRAARLVDDPAAAAAVLGPFRLEMLAPSHAKALGALAAAYGETWTAELVTRWSLARPNGRAASPGPAAWLATLPRLCDALVESGPAGTVVARLLLDDARRWVRKTVESDLRAASPSRRERALSELGPGVAGVVQAAARAGATAVRDDLVALVCAPGTEMLGCACALLRAAPRAEWAASGLDAVAEHCRSALDELLARPARAPGDWSIAPPGGCACALCATLATFLEDSARTRFEWPLREESRAHVHRRIEAAELPVTHETRRSGRPYTLVLAKTDALHARERAQRQQLAAELAWLRGTRPSRVSRARTAR